MAEKQRIPRPARRAARTERGGYKKFFPPKKKFCRFCQRNVKFIDYKSVDILKKYIPDRGKISPRRVTGTCSFHQRKLADGHQAGPASWPCCPTSRVSGEPHEGHPEAGRGKRGPQGRHRQRRPRLRPQLPHPPEAGPGGHGLQPEDDRDRAEGPEEEGRDRSVSPSRTSSRSSTRSTLTFARKAGEKDHIFGSVSAGDIKDALDKLGFDIDKKKIVLDEPIKRLGNYTVPIKVYHDDRAEIKVHVVKEEEAGGRTEAKPAAEEPAGTARDRSSDVVEPGGRTPAPVPPERRGAWNST